MFEKSYRAKPGRENRALAGLSMGGFVVLNTGLSHLDTFSELHVYSSGYISAEDRKAFELNFEKVLNDPKVNDRFRVPLYFAAGETDIALRNSLKTLALFNDARTASRVFDFRRWGDPSSAAEERDHMNAKIFASSITAPQRSRAPAPDFKTIRASFRRRLLHRSCAGHRGSGARR